MADFPVEIVSLKEAGIHADVDLNVIVDSKMIITPEKQPQQ